LLVLGDYVWFAGGQGLEVIPSTPIGLRWIYEGSFLFLVVCLLHSNWLIWMDDIALSTAIKFSFTIWLGCYRSISLVCIEAGELRFINATAIA